MDHGVLHHFSEDPTINRFVPHVPASNPLHPPAVWAIDSDHASLYWFPRDCPRVTMWPRDELETAAFRQRFVTVAKRVHAIEASWLGRMRATTLYRYDLPAAAFAAWADASGQWIASEPVEPISVEPVGDLLAAHVEASIELRIVGDLWPLHDAARDGPWDFSTVRMRHAARRADGRESPPSQ